jgi:hypothetical protein
MPKIEFLYERDCPNVDDGREALRQALRACGLPPQFQEWERHDPAAPPPARRYGSPTILVDGEDIAGEPPTDEPSCRVYSDERGRARGVPPVGLIVAALQRHGTRPARSTPLGLFAFLPAAGAALLPKLTCPACWPAYAALLSSLGLGFVDYTPWLFPATLVFLAVTLALIAWQPRRGLAPLVLGLAASAGVLAGKFAWDSDTAVYAGVALLALASAWNAWPRKAVTSCKCQVPS